MEGDSIVGFALDEVVPIVYAFAEIVEELFKGLSHEIERRSDVEAKALIVYERASTTGCRLFLYDGDAEAGVSESSSSRDAADAST